MTNFSSPSTQENIKKFNFHGKSYNSEQIQIQIPELLSSAYSCFTWPSAVLLSWFLWERRHTLINKNLIEIGAGTALPGILAAKCGAHVVLSDSATLPKSLKHIEKCCIANNLLPGRDIDVIGLSWGLLLNSVFKLNNIDIIIGSDCFYDPTVFEDILVTVSFILDNNPLAKFICSYQERSADWSIEGLLKKWNLRASKINTEDIGKISGILIDDLLGGHTIHLLEISKSNI